MPVVVIPRAVLSLLSWLILAASAYLLWGWSQGYDIRHANSVIEHVRGPIWRLYTGLALLAWLFLGRFVVLLLIPGGTDDPREQRVSGAEVRAPDGSTLHVESIGPADGPALILTHGWGLNSMAWWYTKKALAGRFRLVT